MKTSNKLLLTAFIILLVSLAAYNMALKTEYNKESYKNPYRDFVTLQHQGFNQIRINPATEFVVKVVAGPYKVQVHKEATEFIKVSQKGKQLMIDLVFPDEREYIPYGELVVINCPSVNHLSTNGVYTVKGKEVTNQNEFAANPVTVEGFSQDSFAVQVNKASSVALKETKLKKLQALIGSDAGSIAKLYLNKTNQIQEANLDVQNKSELILDNIIIPKLKYQFGDSARATISGSALGILVP